MLLWPHFFLFTSVQLISVKDLYILNPSILSIIADGMQCRDYITTNNKNLAKSQQISLHLKQTNNNNKTHNKNTTNTKSQRKIFVSNHFWSWKSWYWCHSKGYVRIKWIIIIVGFEIKREFTGDLFYWFCCCWLNGCSACNGNAFAVPLMCSLALYALQFHMNLSGCRKRK